MWPVDAPVGGCGVLQWRRRRWGQPAVGLLMAVRNSSTRVDERLVLAEARFDPAQAVHHGACDRGRRRAGRSAAARGRSARGSGRSRPGGPAAGSRRGWSRSARRGRCRSVRRPAAGSPRPRWPGRCAGDCGMTSAISSELSGLASSEAWAMTRVRAPCSWRMLASMRPASSERAPVSAISIPDSSTRWREHGEAGGQVRRFDGDRQAPLEAVAQARGEGRELARDPVGGEDQLAAGLIERVEGVEELLFGGGLALEELDVVDQQHVDVAVGGLEGLGAGAAQGRDELVGERLGGRVADAEAGSVVVEVVGDRREQVGLAEPGRPVEEERVVGLRRCLGDGQGGAVGESVAGADHEALEGVARVQLRDPGRRAAPSRGAAKLTRRSCVPQSRRRPRRSAPSSAARPRPGFPRGPSGRASRRRTPTGFERLQPKLVGRLRDRRAQPFLGGSPEGVEVCWEESSGTGGRRR